MDDFQHAKARELFSQIGELRLHLLLHRDAVPLIPLKGDSPNHGPRWKNLVQL